MRITVKETQSPGPGKKVGWVIATNGDRFMCWPEKLAGIAVGHAYEIETKSHEYQDRTLHTIVRYKKVEDLVQRMASAARSPTRRSAPVGDGPPDDGVPPAGDDPFDDRVVVNTTVNPNLAAFVRQMLFAWAHAGAMGVDDADIGRAIRAAERAYARIHGGGA